jgi:CRP-like cAMP-binding protein
MAETEDMEQYRSLIRELSLFSYLTMEELGDILSRAEILHYKKGEKIIYLGDVSPYFYGIIKGSVYVTLRELDGNDVFICSIGEGEVFGESAIFMTEKRTADVTSSEDSVVLRMHRKEMMSFIKDNPQAGNKILMLIVHSLLHKLREANQELAFEKQSVIDLDDLDSLVQDFMSES